MKRFDQWSQGYKKPENPSGNGEKKPQSLTDTKKHLGFQWDMSTK